MVKSALAETPLGPMASSIPSFGAEAASGPAHMNPVSTTPHWQNISDHNFHKKITLDSQLQVALMTAISASQREKLAGGPGGPEVRFPITPGFLF